MKHRLKLQTLYRNGTITDIPLPTCVMVEDEIPMEELRDKVASAVAKAVTRETKVVHFVQGSNLKMGCRIGVVLGNALSPNAGSCVIGF